MPFLPFRALASALAVILPVLEPVPVPPSLAPGEAVEQELAGGEAQDFLLKARAGQHLLVTVEQRGINVVLACHDPSGKFLGHLDMAEKRDGLETWLLPAGEGGTYRIAVGARLAEVPPGRFRIGVKELPAGAPELEAERLTTEAGLLSFHREEEPRRQALARYEDALARWRSLGRKEEEARTLRRLATVHQTLDEAKEALGRLEEALPLFSSLGDRAGVADTLNDLGIAQIGLNRRQDATASFERSLEIRRTYGDPYEEALTRLNLCLVRLYAAEWQEAVTCYQEILPLLKEVREPPAIADALNGLGGAYFQLGEPRKAREHYDRALEARRALGDDRGAAEILNNIGALLLEQDSLGEALTFYGEALEGFRRVGSPGWEARILNGLGYAYLILGEPDRALDFLRQSLPIRVRLGDRRGQGYTLRNLGLALEQLGQVEEALKRYEEALEIARESRAEDPDGEARSLNLLAQGHLTAGDPARALELFGQAAAVQHSLGGLAFTLQRTGEVEARLGQKEKALGTLREALGLYGQLDDRSGRAATLASLAAVERDLGLLGQALAHAEESIALVESVRTQVGDPGLRASFFASRRLAFDLAIGLRMDLARLEPGKGHTEAALALSERARARSLFDLLRETRADVRQVIGPVLRERQKDLAFRFGRNASKLRKASNEKERVELRRELSGLLAEADLLEDEIRRRNPRYAVLDQPPLDAAGVRGLLDPDTLLLEYVLGEEKSFLWAVTPERVDGFELPGRAGIEAAALRSAEELRDMKETTGAEAHRTLGRILLGPVADRLPGRRLVIVADGALQYVPFAVLPDPADPAGTAPLVEGHEIVSLPSASVLDVQRRVLAGRRQAEKAVAVLADPVFVSWDSRLPRRASPAAARPKASETRIQRLPWSQREAEAIAALLPSDHVLLALGLEASRGTALSGVLSRYRVVHFATHGWIHPETPRLSGLTLSMVDGQGEPQEGLLSLSDIYGLELGADLVVLSGCETALGKEIRGEGLVGLTQGFLYAGAERVMASLWPVEDRATAELMSRFYRAMFEEKLPPAAALRSAQRAIRRDPRWQDPFFWAPFVLQGDWR